MSGPAADRQITASPSLSLSCICASLAREAKLHAYLGADAYKDSTHDLGWPA